MFRRKLIALEYGNPDETFSDSSLFRKLIVWLEDMKIRHYKIEDRAGLRNTDSSNWEDAAKKYLNDLNCPYMLDQQNSLLDWLLGFAVRLEYGDSADKYRMATPPGGQTSGQTGTLLDEVDCNSAEFKSGVEALAKLLEIAPHPDHFTLLKAAALIISKHLTKEAMENDTTKSGHGPPPNKIPLEKVDLGFEVPDPVVLEVGRILRLLHIKELRELQNLANEAIVSVQTLTADPRTDTKLGQVGKS